MSRELLIKDLNYVTDTVKMMRKLLNRVDDPSGQWNVAYENRNIVDVGNGKWYTFENNLAPRAYADPNNSHTDWITLWNPRTGALVLQMMLDHCQGISQLVWENPELEDKMRVSQSVLDLCAQLRTYSICHEQHDESGDLVVDRRTLADIK